MTGFEYDWDSAEQEKASLADGTYIPENNLPSGLKIHKDVVYMTVPRWLPGRSLFQAGTCKN